MVQFTGISVRLWCVNMGVQGPGAYRNRALATCIVPGDLSATTYRQAALDVAPLTGGVPSPDAGLDAADLLVLQRRIAGLVSFRRCPP